MSTQGHWTFGAHHDHQMVLGRPPASGRNRRAASSADEPANQDEGHQRRVERSQRDRRKRGWSQEEFADRVGIHRTYVGDVERGARTIGLVNIARIAQALGVSVAALTADVDRGP